MNSKVSNDEVRHIAQLARLELSDAEIERFAGELGAILAYVDQLREVNVEDVEPTAHATGGENVFRVDEVAPSPGVEPAMKNAPDHQDGFYKVPKVLDQDTV